MSHLTSHRPSASMVVALLALFVALGGTGYAAVKLKRGSVTSREIRNGSIHARDLAPSVRAELGVPGPKGEQGSQGAAGRNGIAGQRGPQGPAGKDGADCVAGPPAPANPSFDADTATWQLTGAGGFGRTTTGGEFDSAPGAGRWSPATSGTMLIETFTGSFKAGTTYVLRFALMEQEAPGGDTVTADFGKLGVDSAHLVVTPTAAFAAYEIAWTPGADRCSSVSLRFSEPDPGTYLVDSLALSIVSD